MKSELEGRTLTVYPEGRIDSGNAAEVEHEIEALRAASPADELCLDLEGLQYISSAGLRSILRLLRASPSLRMVNVPSEIYEILEMTGFTEMLPVAKAYRRVSIEGCALLGEGANGKVYRLDQDTIVKVYNSADALPDIQRERELARKALILGLPTAIAYDVVRVGELYGAVFELLNAGSFTELIRTSPDKLDEYAALYVDTMRQIHATVVKPGELPDMKAVVRRWGEDLRGHLPENAYARLLSLIRAVPESRHMLHGDYHTNNVMMQNGEVLLIDLDTLCCGDPVFELASVYLAYVGFGEVDPRTVERFLGLDYALTCRLWKQTLRLYFGTDDELLLRSNEDKARVIAYTRLMRRTIRRFGLETPEGRAVIEHCRTSLIGLLERVNTLSLEYPD